ncbi:MAG: hypothetical protein KH420_04890 [Clostridiales bacterium]|nr:hypothetical protein [Clostridiales bacterium]
MQEQFFDGDATFLPDEAICALAKRLGTPFYLYDEQSIRIRAEEIRSAFAWNPGHQEWFPVAAAPNPSVLKLLHLCGCRAVVSSVYDLELARRCGFRPEEILYHVVYPRPQDVEIIMRRRPMLVFNTPELLHRFVAGGAVDGCIGLRFNPGGEYLPGSNAMGRSVKSKFGMSKEEILRAAKMLRRAGVQKIGLCLGFAKNQISEGYYPAVAKTLFELALDVQEVIEIAYLDLMGGIGIDYRHGGEDPRLQHISEQIEELSDDLLAPMEMDQIPIYTELGRYLMAPCAILVSSITHLRHSFREFIALDASAADLVRPMLYSGDHHISIVGRHEVGNRRYYDVVGPMNNSSDRFGERRLLPIPEPGDLCLLHDVGAHCAGSTYSHGGYFRCAEYLWTREGKAVQIGAPVTPEPFFEPPF